MSVEVPSSDRQADRITNGNEEHDSLGVGGELSLVYETNPKTRHLLPSTRDSVQHIR